jgi:WD40 repeat protein
MSIRVWNVEDGSIVLGPPHSFQGHTNYVMSAVYSPDGKWIASGCYDGIIRIFDAKNGYFVSKPIREHTGGVCSVAFSLDGRRMVSGSDDKTVQVYDVQFLPVV